MVDTLATSMWLRKKHCDVGRVMSYRLCSVLCGVKHHGDMTHPNGLRDMPSEAVTPLHREKRFGAGGDCI